MIPFPGLLRGNKQRENKSDALLYAFRSGFNTGPSISRRDKMKRTSHRVKSTIWVLLVLMIWLYGGGRINAENYAAHANRTVPLSSLESRFDDLLSELKEVVRQGGAKAKTAPEKGFADIEKVIRLKERLAEEDEKIQEYFDGLEDFMERKKLPDEILSRHKQFASEYRARYEALMADLDGIESAHEAATGFWSKFTGANKKVDWDGVIGKTLNFLEENTPRPHKSNFDPKNLPHRALKADKPIPPKLTREEWLNAFAKEAAPSASAQPSSVKAQGSITLAATAPPTPADLAETIEVKFTPEIQQLADSLGRNPVKIFNWVRNNIEFVPTWGSIQGAELCMENRTGNAFDTSSLLIALLRYSGIPARYQMGTIDVPIDKAMNWLGGFTDSRAAARFAASGGVPSAGTVEQGGVLRSLRMEHVWVKAYLDYAPSEAAVNAHGDGWVDIDASFKLHVSTSGSDLLAASGFDPTAFNNHLESTAITNEAEGFVTGIDQAFIVTTVNSIADKFSAAFPGNDPDTLLVTRSIIAKELPVVPNSGPYRVISKGPAVSELTSAMRHLLLLTVADKDGRAILTFATTLPEIGSKSISVNYTFSTQADVDLVRSVLPSDIVNSVTPPSPQHVLDAIPAYLVSVRPLIKLDGITVNAGDRVGMGEAQTITIGFTAPTIQTPPVTLDLVAWGQYGITMDIAGTSKTPFLTRVDRLHLLAQQYEAANGQGLSAGAIDSRYHDLIRSAWFLSADNRSNIIARGFGIRFTRYPSLAFSYADYTFSSILGVPVRGLVGGYFLDVARQLHIATALDGDIVKEMNFNISAGLISSLLEGKVIPQIVFGQEPSSGGISAANAINSASQQGIPIYAIDSQNVDMSLAHIDQSYPSEAISDAVNAGRVVIVPQRPPVMDGELIDGYITMDPISGDAAYLVGRAHGGRLECLPDLSPTDMVLCQQALANAEFWETLGFILLAVATVGFLIAASIGGALLAVSELTTTLLKLAVVVGSDAALFAVLFDLGVCLVEGPKPPHATCARELLAFDLRFTGLGAWLVFLR